MTDDITRSLALLAVDNVRMKADIIQLRDKQGDMKYIWKSLDNVVNRNEQQIYEIEDLKKNLLTTQVVLVILALSAAIAAFI